jgi:hypothetical protein
VAEAYSIVADCIAQAIREDTLLKQLSAFVTAAYRSGFADQSMMRFTVAARLEFHRSPSLRDNPGPVISAVQGFYASMVDDAIARGEIAADTDPVAVVNMLLAIFLGVGFYAGFVVERNDIAAIAKQFHELMAYGLLDQHRNGRPHTIAAPVPVTIAADDYPQAWPEPTG